MPALAYRRRSYRRRLGKPRKFVWTVVGPVTYDKTGALIGGALLAGADVFEAAESGSMIATAVLSGTSQATLNRAPPPRYPYPIIRRRSRMRMP